MTTTIATAVTLTVPCTPQPTACDYNHHRCNPPSLPEPPVCPYEHGCPPEPEPTGCPDGYECILPPPERPASHYEQGYNPPEPEPTPSPPEPPICIQEHGCSPPEPEHPVCVDSSDCRPHYKGPIGYNGTGLAARNNGSSCGANNASACPDGTSPHCICQRWGWECVCLPETGRLT